MNWLRLYHEARTDKKLQALTDKQFRVWFNLLCFSSEQTDRGVIAYDDLYLLSVEVARGDVALLEKTIEVLVRLRILSTGTDEVTFINFGKRQYGKPSDAPDRVASRVETHRKRQRNADVTPRNDIDTDTERELTPKAPKGDEYPAEFSEFWSAYPNKKAKGDAYQVWRRIKSRPPLVVMLQAITEQKLSDQWAKDGGAFIPHPSTWLRHRRWEDEASRPGLVMVNGLAMPADIAALPWNSSRRLKWENDHRQVAS